MCPQGLVQLRNSPSGIHTLAETWSKIYRCQKNVYMIKNDQISYVTFSYGKCIGGVGVGRRWGEFKRPTMKPYNCPLGFRAGA